MDIINFFQLKQKNEKKFLDIPIEMHFKIFNFLDLNSILNCRLTCKLWNFYLNNFILKKNNLKFIKTTKYDQKNYLSNLFSMFKLFCQCEDEYSLIVISNSKNLDYFKIKNDDKLKFRISFIEYNQSLKSFNPKFIKNQTIILFIGILKLKDLIKYRDWQIFYSRFNINYGNNEFKRLMDFKYTFFINFDFNFFNHLNVAFNNHLFTTNEFKISMKYVYKNIRNK
jgi:hypothetical protein